MAQMFRSLPPMWEIWIAFHEPGPAVTSVGIWAVSQNKDNLSDLSLLLPLIK